MRLIQWRRKEASPRIGIAVGQGERFLAWMQVAASVPALGEAVASLLRARERLVVEIGQLDRQLTNP
jgi:hypothetical protein